MLPSPKYSCTIELKCMTKYYTLWCYQYNTIECKTPQTGSSSVRFHFGSFWEMSADSRVSSAYSQLLCRWCRQDREAAPGQSFVAHQNRHQTLVRAVHSHSQWQQTLCHEANPLSRLYPWVICVAFKNSKLITLHLSLVLRAFVWESQLSWLSCEIRADCLI